MSALATVIAYHQRTKHHFHRYAASLGYMDWANQPNPFRQYEGAIVTQLKFNSEQTRFPYERLYEPNPVPPVLVNLGTLSNFFYYSLGLSAWKATGPNRWALRVNPSSGNLHPTEAYVLVKSLGGEQDMPGLYHYVSETHSLERRAPLAEEVWQLLMGHLPGGSFLVGLSSIIWREAWKYGERAFRYCQHDMGHAVAALRFSAALCGWQLTLIPSWSTEDVATLLGLHRQQDFVPEEAEEAELLAIVVPNGADANFPAVLPTATETIIDEIRSADWYGRANRLSHEHVPWPVIDEVTAATRVPRGTDANKASYESQIDQVAGPPALDVDARQVIYQRRSCLALDGVSGTAQETFLRMIGRTLPGAHPPWDALYWTPTIHLALFVHRVEGLAQGLYFLVRDPAKKVLLKQSMRKAFVWQTPPGIPENFPLYLLTEGDCSEAARAVSCHQDIAAEGFFSLGMIADFDEPLRRHGAWFYRNLYWEAGMIGQVLYLEAEAAGARSTGIGCYFDDPVHQILGLKGNRFQDLYHFTVGVHVEDPRLQTLTPLRAGDETSDSQVSKWLT